MYSADNCSFTSKQEISRRIFLRLICILFVFAFWSSSHLCAQQLWGTTQYGGANFEGTVFQLDLDSNTYDTMWDLIDSTGRNSVAPLLQANGSLFGVTTYGGAYGYGVIFEYYLPTHSYYKRFDFNGAYGKYPIGGLMKASNKKLYGTTNQGGANDLGIIFELDLNNNIIRKLFDFSTSSGSKPRYALMQATNGKLYGVTSSGGDNNAGTLFEYDYTDSVFTKLHNFTSEPYGAPVQPSNENLYGIINYTTSPAWGAIYEYNITASSYTKKYDFTQATGYQAVVLTQTSAGTLWGTTEKGGANGAGVIFEYDPFLNTYTKRYDFINTTGRDPRGALLESYSHKLYGTTHLGGANSNGVIFEFDPATSTYTKLLDFNNTTGDFPEGNNLIEVFYPEIAVSGFDQVIENNDYFPRYEDGTDFGNVNIGDSLDVEYIVENFGLGDLLFTGSPRLTITGPDASEFKIIYGGAIYPIPYLYSHYIKISFQPSRAGVCNAYVHFETNDLDERYFEFAIQGTGIGGGDPTWILTVNAEHGSVTKNPNKPAYADSEAVFLTASPDAGYHFNGWSGDLSGIENPDTIIMNGNKTVTANFDANQFSMTVEPKWNLISLPYKSSSAVKASLFPSAKSSAFAFDGGYVAKDTLHNGKGYWLKFDSTETITASGYDTLTADTITVINGWNIIGSLTNALSVSSITSIPPGIVESQFFGYVNGYNATAMLQPGKGYWVKVNNSGQLILSSTLSKKKISVLK